MAERVVTRSLVMVLLVFSAISIGLASSANGMTPPYQPIDEMDCREDRYTESRPDLSIMNHLFSYDKANRPGTLIT